MKQLYANHSFALVIGGSAAGLLSALELAKSFDNVTVIDKHDILSNAPNPFVPQSDQINALAHGGIVAMNSINPEILQYIGRMGFEPVDPGAAIRYAEGPSWSSGVETALETIYAPRRTFDAGLIAAVLRRPNISFRRGIVTQANIHEASQEVEIVTKSGSLGKFKIVIDARGRHRPSFDIVEDAASGVTTRDDINLYMQTALYRQRTVVSDGWKVIVIGEAPMKGARGSFVVNFDNTFSVAHGDRMERPAGPTHESMLQFARRLPNDTIARLIEGSDPISFGTPYRYAKAIYRHFDRTRGFPPGILVIGDAHISTNPMYGLGISLAAVGAQTLGEVLKSLHGETWSGLAPTYYRAMKNTTDLAWHITSRVDRWLGPNSPLARLPRMFELAVASVRDGALRDDRLAKLVLSNAQLSPFARKVSSAHVVSGAIRGYRRPALEFRPIRTIENLYDHGGVENHSALDRM